MICGAACWAGGRVSAMGGSVSALAAGEGSEREKKAHYNKPRKPFCSSPRNRLGLVFAEEPRGVWSSPTEEA